MPKQHSFAGQTNPPSEKKTDESVMSAPRQSPSLPVETLGEEIRGTVEILEAFAEFPWLIALLFPVFISLAWLQKRAARP